VKVAYLAPEIPALSATFVYKEIQTLEEQGVEVIPFSIHKPINEASEKELQALKEKTVYVYQSSAFKILWIHLFLILTTPINYISCCFMLFGDMLKLGLVSRKSFGMLYRFFYAAKIALQLKKSDCKHLHVHFAHVPTDVAMYATKMVGGSFSVTAHANDLFERGWLLKQKVERSSFFGTISEFNKRFLENQGIDVEKVRVIRCGVDEQQFSPREFKAPKKPFKIGMVGRLVEKKGVDTLIDAAKLVIDSGVEIKVEIAGSGPLESELKQQSASNKFNDDVVSFVGALPHDQVVDFIKSLDAFVLPCKKDKHGDMDGIPVVLMEAMLSGVPVISTKLSGIPELIDDKNTGLLVPPNNVEALSEAIIDIYSNQQQTKKMVAKAIDKVRNEFSIHINSERLKALFMGSIN
jgi:glycosyltransferase involved in cell wall biosynthesis